MANKGDVLGALSSSSKEFQCVMFPEPYHVWMLSKPWNGAELKAKGLSIVAIELKASKIVGKHSEERISKRNPVKLKCGIPIEDGRIGMTAQNQTARFVIRPDDIHDLNIAVKELCTTYGFDMWEVSRLQVYNAKLGATMFYEIHCPDGLSARLYLKRVETSEYCKGYESISLYDQQRLCNGFYEYFAACAIENRTMQSHTCALKRRREAMRKAA